MEFPIAKSAQNGADARIGTVSVFQRGNRVYTVTVQYPAEYAKGFLPRVSKLLEDMMWYDAR